MKNIWHEIRDYVIIIAVVVLVRTFLVTPAIVDGASMDYTLEDGQLVFINKLIYRIKDIKRFDIVVVNNEINKDKIIKRVIGLPGETIRYTIIDDNGTSKGVLYINDNIVKEEFLSVEASSKTFQRLKLFNAAFSIKLLYTPIESNTPSNMDLFSIQHSFIQFLYARSLYR